MRFLNDPENTPIKVLLLVLLFASAGYFAYSAMHQNPLTNTGAVISVKLPTVTTNAPMTIAKDSAVVSGLVTSTGGDVAGVQASFEYGDAPYFAKMMAAGASTGSFYATLTGLACDTTYSYRAKVANSAGTAVGNAVTFKTLSCSTTSAPGKVTADTAMATDVTTTSATLRGSAAGALLAGGAAASFDYGATTSYGSNKVAPQLWGSGPFSVSLSGLTCGTMYYYRSRVVVSGQTAYGNPVKLVTSACPKAGPSTTISTLGARPTTVGATLNAVVAAEPTWMKITAGFEYGLTTTYGSSVSAKNTAPGPFSADITGLPRGTTYHYRAWAKNAATGAVIYGKDATFKTI